jgi:hypothetical protein
MSVAKIKMVNLIIAQSSMVKLLIISKMNLAKINMNEKIMKKSTMTILTIVLN